MDHNSDLTLDERGDLLLLK